MHNRMKHNARRTLETISAIRENIYLYFFACALVLLPLLFAAQCLAYDRRTPIVEAVAKAGPAVVNIRTEQIVKRRSTPFFGFSDPFFEDFFRDLVPPRVYKTQSLGSGVIVDPRGYILTNAHVIEKASKVYVALPDSAKELEAQIVGKAERIDLAVLKISGDAPFAHLPPGKGEDLFVGETVIAIGNPLGLGHSVTTGVVSAPQRRLSLDEGMFSVFIQTDALINPGNSGGPLLNINGELIGINTAIAKQAQGIGFSIPIAVVNRIMPDLIKHGHVRKAYLGIIPAPVGKAFRHDTEAGGVLVKEVEEHSPAANKKIIFGDVILAIDDMPVTSPMEFLSILDSYTPEQNIRMNILRGFETVEISVRLAELPPNYGIAYGKKMFGFTVKKSRRGVVVAKVTEDSPAHKVGIRRGDLVAEVAGESCDSVDEYLRLITANIGRVPLRFLVFRGNRGYYVDLP